MQSAQEQLGAEHLLPWGQREGAKGPGEQEGEGAKPGKDFGTPPTPTGPG